MNYGPAQKEDYKICPDCRPQTKGEQWDVTRLIKSAVGFRLIKGFPRDEE